MTAIAIFGLATITMAQVPSYVPTTGLVGWWPFNSNANDESGNGNNGTVNGGTTLSTDRFGNSNNAYYFDGVNDYISNILSMNSTDSLTISLWYLSPIPTNISSTHFELWESNNLSNQIHLNFSFNPIPTGYMYTFIPGIGQASDSMGTRTYNAWHHIVVVKAGITETVYVDNIPNFGQFTGTNSTLNFDKFELGREFTTGGNLTDTYYIGKLDDIGIWNRALTQQEITDLYNGCQLSVSTQPINQSVNISNNAQFTTASSDPLSTYQWQTDLGVGFQNLNSVGQYSGTANDTLTIANTTLSNNNQPFRCIVSSGSCTDTSSVAVLTIVNTVGINEFTQDNLFSVYPNPAKSQINVKTDAKLLGSVYTIYDNTGKLVLSGKINSENTVIELGNLSGGIYLFSVGENLKQTFKVIKE